jgi:fatty acid desaturase
MTVECLTPQTDGGAEFSDEQLRGRVRAMVPTEVFRRRPWRLMYAVLLIAAIVACLWGTSRTPWYLAIPLSLLAGHTWGCLMFFGHEIAHGAVTGSRWIQDAVLYACCCIYCISPRFWRHWHNAVHHGHANVDIRDPDHFGSIPRYEAGGFWRRFIIENAPGSGRALSYLYPFIFFTGHGQGVLWVESVDADEFRGANRTRAKIESFIMLACWIALALLTGWRGTLLLVILPMLAANFTVMIYIFTNHLLRPLADRPSSLDNTMSVTTLKLIDRIHFHFSHHIEHHLFPAVSSANYPIIRRALQQIAGDRYLAPPHWWAVKVLYSTPRLYETPTHLLEPTTGRRVSIAAVEELLDLH